MEDSTMEVTVTDDIKSLADSTMEIAVTDDTKGLAKEECVDEAFEIQLQEEPIISRETKVQLLKDVNQLMNNEGYSSSFVTLYLDDGSIDPLLSILPAKSDPFYVDQALLHANVTISNDSEFEFTYFTPNREKFGETIVVKSDISSQLPTLLNRLSSEELISCPGFSWFDTRLGTLFQRLRKSDIDWCLIEKFNGSIFYRARACKYVYSKEELAYGTGHPFFANQCNDCQMYLRDLDKKYMSGKILELPTPLNSIGDIKTDSEAIDDLTASGDISLGDIKRKRGRPKGSKNKSYGPIFEDRDHMLEAKEENDENDPSVAVDIIMSGRVFLIAEFPNAPTKKKQIFLLILI